MRKLTVLLVALCLGAVALAGSLDTGGSSLQPSKTVPMIRPDSQQWGG